MDAQEDSNTDEPNVQRGVPHRALSLIHVATLTNNDEEANQLSNKLGIFVEDDLKVLFDYCNRTKGAGLTDALKERE